MAHSKAKNPETTGKKNQNEIEIFIGSDDPELIAAAKETVSEIFKIVGNQRRRRPQAAREL